MSFVLGLTGGIATGKTTVTHFFERRQIPVVDSDKIAREVVEPETTGLEKIIQFFGKEIINAEGRLDRAKLGGIIFKDEQKRIRLNEILHDELLVAINQKIAGFKALKYPLIVVDVPLMYEASYEKFMDQVMVVYTPETIQLNRLISRDHLNEKEALQRIASQLSIEKKKELADIVIDNSQTIEKTNEQVANWLQEKFPELS